MSLFFKAASGESRSANWFATGDEPRASADNTSAMRLTSVFAAFRHIVDYVSTLPVDAYRLDGTTQVDAPRPSLLTRQDEPGGLGLIAWLGQLAYGLATGNAVGWIQGIDGYGFPTDVSWIHWSEWSYDEYAKEWRIFGRPVPSSQILHIPWIVPPGRQIGRAHV